MDELNILLFLAMINNVAVKVEFQIDVLLFSNKYPVVGMLDHMVVVFFIF